jgi:hypothetical protein
VRLEPTACERISVLASRGFLLPCLAPFGCGLSPRQAGRLARSHAAASYNGRTYYPPSRSRIKCCRAMNGLPVPLADRTATPSAPLLGDACARPARAPSRRVAPGGRGADRCAGPDGCDVRRVRVSGARAAGARTPATAARQGGHGSEEPRRYGPAPCSASRSIRPLWRCLSRTRGA